LVTWMRRRQIPALLVVDSFSVTDLWKQVPKLNKKGNGIHY
jgi:hypothetical protein